VADARATQAPLLVLAGGADTAVTQSPVLALAGGSGGVAVTQAPLLALASIPTLSIRATAGALLTLAGDMADIRNTQTALLALARHVNCLTRWAQCWKITTVKPRYSSETISGTELAYRSNDVLYPWIDGDVDPRNCRNDHEYRWRKVYENSTPDEYGDWVGTLDEAITGGNIATDGGFQIYQGWTLEGENNEMYPVYGLVPAESEILELCYNRAAPVATYGNAGTTVCQLYLSQGVVVGGSLGWWSGQRDNGEPWNTFAKAGIYYLVPGSIDGPVNPPDGAVFANNCVNYPPSMEGYFPAAMVVLDQRIQARRVPRTPDNPCAPQCQEAYPLVPGSPDYCEIDVGIYERNLGWIEDEDTYKMLSIYAVNSGAPVDEKVIRYPLNPALRSDDPNYSSQAYWDAAYAAAVESGDLPGGMTYDAEGDGDATTYPRTQDYAWVRNLNGTPGEPGDNFTVLVPDQVMLFTSHDQPVTFQGEVYQPCNSLAASASDLGVVLGNAGDMELNGIIADAGISENDLYAGLFDRALVEVWMVPWEAAPGETPFRLTAGVVGDISQGDEMFVADVQTSASRLQQQPLLEVYTPGCRWELGDSRCGIDLDALAVTGTVTGTVIKHAATRAHHRIFTDSSREEEDGYFNLGVIEWTTGLNFGQRSEIKTYTAGQFVLWQPMPHPIEVGDGYEARPGCDKTPGTCKTKFDNYARYGGFPDVPGNDAILQSPNAS
jgi:uncharacterized phage protein (TIGR02218 family)